MNIKALKKKLIGSINKLEDGSFLNALNVIIEGHVEYDYMLTKKQEGELIRRSNAVKNGTAKLIPWEEVKKELKNKIKYVHAAPRR